MTILNLYEGMQDQVKLKDASEIEYFHIRLMTYTEKDVNPQFSRTLR